MARDTGIEDGYILLQGEQAEAENLTENEGVPGGGYHGARNEAGCGCLIPPLARVI